MLGGLAAGLMLLPASAAESGSASAALGVRVVVVRRCSLNTILPSAASEKAGVQVTCGRSHAPTTARTDVSLPAAPPPAIAYGDALTGLPRVDGSGAADHGKRALAPSNVVTVTVNF